MPKRCDDVEIIRYPGGSLVAPVAAGRHHDGDDVASASTEVGVEVVAQPTTRVLHPGEVGCDKAMTEWA